MRSTTTSAAPVPPAPPGVTVDTQPIVDLLARLERWLGHQPDVRHVQHLAQDMIQVDVYGVGVVHLTLHRPGR